MQNVYITIKDLMQDEPWCFYGVLPVKKGCVDVQPKVECGELYNYNPDITTSLHVTCLLIVGLFVGEVGIQRKECEDMGCCWVISETVKSCQRMQSTCLTNM